MKKRLFAIALTVVLFITSASATESITTGDKGILNTQEIATQYISLESEDSTATIISSIPLYNLNDELEAYCHIYAPTGYAIVNTNNGTVTEYSETADSPIPTSLTERVYYNGPLMYFTKNGQTYTHIKSGYTLDVADAVTTYHHYGEPVALNGAEPLTVATVGNLNHGLSTLTQSQSGVHSWCPITGVSIFLHYYVNYKGVSFPNGITSASGILNYLRNNNYMTDQPIWLNNALWEHKSNNKTYKGLWNFCTTKSDLDLYVSGINWDSICSSIYNDQPVVLEIPTSAVSSGADGNHIVVVHGFWSGGNNNTNYLNVNNGWGSNNVKVRYNDLNMSYDYLYGVMV